MHNLDQVRAKLAAGLPNVAQHDLRLELVPFFQLLQHCIFMRLHINSRSPQDLFGLIDKSDRESTLKSWLDADGVQLFD